MLSKTVNDIITFDEHLESRYGKIGTERRTEFEIKAKSFAIGEILREAMKANKKLNSSHPELDSGPQTA